LYGFGDEQGMKEPKNRLLNAAEKKQFRRIILVLLFFLGLVLLFFPGRGLLSYRSMRQRVARLAEDNQSLSQQNRALREEIERLQHDDVYLESLARKKYGLLKDNETVYEFKVKGRKK